MPELPAARHARMVELIKHLAPGEGYVQTPLDGVTLMRSNRALSRTPALYEPSIVIVIQGRKRGFHGGRMYVYDQKNYLVLPVPLPFSTETEASLEAPMLGIALRIDPVITAQLAMEIDEGEAPPVPRPATLYASPMDAKLEDAALRLLEALCSPREARTLGAAIVREINYRVLTGTQSANLRAALQQNTHHGRIAKVLRYIHTHYARELDVATLADTINMSAPAFHAHFKAVTATSPIQYIKTMRLHQARLLMIRQGLSASSACEQVGYKSPSQFNREFKRLFGRPPLQEARAMQSIFALGEPVH